MVQITSVVCADEPDSLDSRHMKRRGGLQVPVLDRVTKKRETLTRCFGRISRLVEMPYIMMQAMQSVTG